MQAVLISCPDVSITITTLKLNCRRGFHSPITISLTITRFLHLPVFTFCIFNSFTQQRYHPLVNLMKIRSVTNSHIALMCRKEATQTNKQDETMYSIVQHKGAKNNSFCYVSGC